MQATAKMAALVAAAVLGTVVTTWAVPEVSNVDMQQKAGRIVEITYDLDDEDAIVTVSIEANGVPIPDSAVTCLVGDVCKKVTAGAGKKITWNAGVDWPENVVTDAVAYVTAWATNTPPLYCAVDILNGTAEGEYPVSYYVSADGVPGGVTNDAYKTVLILMRRVDPTGALGFTMGSPESEKAGGLRQAAREAQVQTFLSYGYYAGVYQITQMQWSKVMGTWPSHRNNVEYRNMRPVENVSYETIRGTIAGAAWPGSGNDDVDADSFMYKLREKTGLGGFDLPTEAQWEYACRAGTTGSLNDGTVHLTLPYDPPADPKLSLLGRYVFDGGNAFNGTTYSDPPAGCDTTLGTAEVGSYMPNAWGLYDMHGNVSEWCLDWDADVLAGGLDPKGPTTSGVNRIIRGGAWSDRAYTCRSAHRSVRKPTQAIYFTGFRLVRNLQ